jgi:ABC-type nitrate/sulfonate/bicarbonate transport system permease component
MKTEHEDAISIESSNTSAVAPVDAPFSIRALRLLRQYAPPLMLMLLLLVAWQVGTWVTRVPKWLLPSPWQIIQAGAEASDLLGPHVRRTIYPLLVASQTVPILALAPLLIIWFGYGILPKVIVVGLVCFFPIVVSTADGLRVADPDLIALLRAMGANRRQIFWKVRLPGALPSFFSGLKIAITYCVVGAVIGEWVGASRGLGIFMIRSSKNFLTDRVFAAIAVTSLLSIMMFVAVVALEYALLPWYHAHREEVWEET